MGTDTPATGNRWPRRIEAALLAAAHADELATVDGDIDTGDVDHALRVHVEAHLRAVLADDTATPKTADVTISTRSLTRVVVVAMVFYTESQRTVWQQEVFVDRMQGRPGRTGTLTDRLEAALHEALTDGRGVTLLTACQQAHMSEAAAVYGRQLARASLDQLRVEIDAWRLDQTLDDARAGVLGALLDDVGDDADLGVYVEVLDTAAALCA